VDPPSDVWLDLDGLAGYLAMLGCPPGRDLVSVDPGVEDKLARSLKEAGDANFSA
jgi:hypothetical protein